MEAHGGSNQTAGLFEETLVSCYNHTGHIKSSNNKNKRNAGNHRNDSNHSSNTNLKSQFMTKGP